MKNYATNGLYGKYGEYEPRFCAVTTLPLQTGAYTYSLDGEYYIKVNPLATNMVTSGFKKTMLDAIAPKPSKRKSGLEE